MKMRNAAGVVFERSLQLLRLAAACSKITRTWEFVLFTNLTDTERIFHEAAPSQGVTTFMNLSLFQC